MIVASPAVDLGGRIVGDGWPVYVVAELGPNWCVSADPGRNRAELSALVYAAAAAGADCVKVQLKSLYGYYRSEDLSAPIGDPRSPFATRGEYVTAREPDRDTLAALAGWAADAGVVWTASPWDVQSVELLAEHAVPWIKVASPTLASPRTLAAIADVGLPVVLSTGAADLSEVDAAVSTLGRGELIVAHCVSTYPLDPLDANLRMIDTYRQRYGVPVGYSGHERGLAVSLAAAVMGACWIERHFTLDRSAWGPDHAASLEPEGLRRLVRDLRVVEQARGDGVKRLPPCEEAARKRLRREGL